MLASSGICPSVQGQEGGQLQVGGGREEKDERASGKQGAGEQHTHTGGRCDVTFRTSGRVAKFVRPRVQRPNAAYVLFELQLK